MMRAQITAHIARRETQGTERRDHQVREILAHAVSFPQDFRSGRSNARAERQVLEIRAECSHHRKESGLIISAGSDKIRSKIFYPGIPENERRLKHELHCIPVVRSLRTADVLKRRFPAHFPLRKGK